MKKTSKLKPKQYYKQIKHTIPKKYPHRLEVISSIQQDISSYISENPGISYEDILEHFGTPEEIAISFTESLSSSEIVHSTHGTQKRHFFIFSTMILCICTLVFFVYFLLDTTAAKIDSTVYVYPETEINID